MKDIIIEDSINSDEINPKSERDMKCAPSNDFKDGSCIPLEVMVNMAEAYNQDFKDSSIILHSKLESLNPEKYKRYLVKEFGNRLANVCDTQRCWVKQKFTRNMKKELKKYANKHIFRPSGPEGKFEWLNTYNINDVMGQYEKKYDDFKFLGAVPIDFDDLPQLGLKDMDFNKLKTKGINKIGIVFNLDEHYKSGSHWVAMFGDLKDGKIFFSDSYGVEPEKRIRKLMRKTARFYKEESGHMPDVKHNKKRHQFGNSECGVYSINFILRLLKGESFENITGNRTTDNAVNKCRKVYFQ